MLIAHGTGLRGQVQELQKFLHERFYRHPHLMQLSDHARGVLTALYRSSVERPEEMPPWYRAWAEQVGLRRAVCDYLAGMTDRFAEQEFERLGGGRASRTPG